MSISSLDAKANLSIEVDRHYAKVNAKNNSSTLGKDVICCRLSFKKNFHVTLGSLRLSENRFDGLNLALQTLIAMFKLLFKAVRIQDIKKSAIGYINQGRLFESSLKLDSTA